MLHLSSNQGDTLSLKQWDKLVHRDDLFDFQQARDTFLCEQKATWDVDVRLLTQANQWHWFNLRGMAQKRSAEGAPLLIKAVVIDINERKLGELKVKESHVRLTHLDRQLKSVMFYQVEIQPEGERQFTYVSENVAMVNGVTAEQVKADANTLYSQVHPDYIEKLIEAENRALETMSTFIQEVPLRLPNGELKWFQLISTPFKLPNNKVVWDGIELDVTSRKQAESELKKILRSQAESAEMLQLVINTIPQFIFWKNSDSIYLGCNENFARAAGVKSPTEIVGKTDYDLPWKKEESDFFREVDKRVMDSNTPELNIVESQQRQNDGKQSWLNTNKAPLHDADGNVVGILGTYEDITEKIRMQELVAQSEKMLSIGGLAAGMAHEINNPLAAIIQTTQLLRMRLFNNYNQNRVAADKSGTSMEAISAFMHERRIDTALQSMEKAGLQAAEIVKDMLSFSRLDADTMTPNHVPKILDKALELSTKDYDFSSDRDFRKIKIIKEYESPLAEVICSPNRIQQVFLNILKNGAEAMGKKRYVDDTPCFKLKAYADDTWLNIEITDNGPGMPLALQKRVFEPFFTTKDVGEGTGLGMSVSYFIIVTAHKGKLSIDSCEGQWTRFTISLPL